MVIFHCYVSSPEGTNYCIIATVLGSLGMNQDKLSPLWKTPKKIGSKKESHPLRAQAPLNGTQITAAITPINRLFQGPTKPTGNSSASPCKWLFQPVLGKYNPLTTLVVDINPSVNPKAAKIYVATTFWWQMFTIWYQVPRSNGVTVTSHLGLTFSSFSKLYNLIGMSSLGSPTFFLVHNLWKKSSYRAGFPTGQFSKPSYIPCGHLVRGCPIAIHVTFDSQRYNILNIPFEP